MTQKKTKVYSSSNIIRLLRSSRVSFGRYKRDLEESLDVGSPVVVVDEEVKPVGELLDDIAKEEITEVDIIMEDITDEIKDLQVSVDAFNYVRSTILSLSVVPFRTL